MNPDGQTRAASAGPATRADARRNRRHLLDAAAATFLAQGADTSPVAVAASAGVGVGTLYRHFPSRDALLEAVLHERYERLRETAESLLDAADPVGALCTWLHAFTTELTAIRGVAAALNRTALRDDGRGDSNGGGECQAMLAAWDALVSHAQDRGVIGPDINPRELLRIANAIAWATEQAPARSAEASRLLALVIDGLRYRVTDPSTPS